MRIDCCDLACPEPVLRTKKALEELDNDSILEVLVNSVSSVENVKRFASKSGYEARSEELEGSKTLITIIKGYECTITPESGKKSFLNKSVFIKSDRVGNGELGKILIRGFIKAMLEFEQLPKNIIFVNEGVFLTTKEENSDVTGYLRELENRGVQIYSCGLCMNHFNIPAEELKAGQIGNAYDTVDMLLNTDVVNF